jgi:hypothetical protein
MREEDEGERSKIWHCGVKDIGCFYCNLTRTPENKRGILELIFLIFHILL